MVDGYISPGHVPDVYKSSANAPHTDLHDATSDMLDLLADAIPAAVGDLAGVDVSIPAGTGRLLLIYDTVSGDVSLGREVDPGGGYVSTTTLGAADGVATLDSASRVEQAPAVHTHGIAIRDGDGTLYQRPELRLYVDSGALTDDSGNNALKVDLRSADVRTLRVLSASTRAVTNSATLTELTDLTVALVEGDAFDFDLDLEVQSTGAADVKIELQVANAVGGTPELHYRFLAPHSGEDTADPSVMRHIVVDIPTNGPQQAGGFLPSTSSKSWANLKGTVRMPTGATSGSLRVRFAQATATSGVTTTVTDFHSKMILNRIS